MSASTKSLGAGRGFLACWLPAGLAVVLLVPYVVLAMFCTGHDSYDDSGYMLASLRGVAGGGRLYEDVFSQYGPFHAGAWVLFLRSFGLPIDHDHAALCVALLWLASAGGAAWCVRRLTANTWWALAAALWCAWALFRLVGELAHPKSLVAALGALVLAAGCFDRRRAGAAVAGAAVAALCLTKVNLGLFALVALALAWWQRTAPRRWFALAAGAGSCFVPLLLLRHAWPETPRLLLGASVCLATLLILQCARRPPSTAGAGERENRREAAAFLGAFLLTGALIVLGARIAGTSFSALLDGVWLRPMGLRDSFSRAPEVDPWEWLPLLVSAVLAVLWQVPALRARRELWRTALVLVVAAEFFWDATSAASFCLTSPALLWLAVAAQPAGEANGERTHRWLVSGALFAAWQALGVFPVFGAQMTLPHFLVHGVWLAALGAAFLQPAGARVARAGAVLALAAKVVVVVGLAVLATDAGLRTRALLARNVRVALPGTDWFRWPAEQSAVLGTLAANLRQCEGPLFTFHGQGSLHLWAEKPPVNGFNCTHTSALLRPAELADTLERFRAAPRWSAVLARGGESFGRGPAFAEIDEFLRRNTRPWLRLGEYEVRLAGQAPPNSPRNALWKSAGRWLLQSAEPAAGTATRARLRAGGRVVANLRWQPVPLAEPTAAPEELRVALEALAGSEATLLLCDARWEPLALLPVVTVAAAGE